MAKKEIYDLLKDGHATITEPGGIFWHQCCDCGLVHEHHIYVCIGKKEYVALLTERDDKRTADVRRREYRTLPYRPRKK